MKKDIPEPLGVVWLDESEEGLKRTELTEENIKESMKTEPEKDIIGYIQEVEGLKSDIEYLNEDIRQLEQDKEYYRVEANKDHKELIEEFQTDLDSLNPNIPYQYEPLNKLKEKWQGRIK